MFCFESLFPSLILPVHLFPLRPRKYGFLGPHIFVKVLEPPGLTSGCITLRDRLGLQAGIIVILGNFPPPSEAFRRIIENNRGRLHLAGQGGWKEGFHQRSH